MSSLSAQWVVYHPGSGILIVCRRKADSNCEVYQFHTAPYLIRNQDQSHPNACVNNSNNRPGYGPSMTLHSTADTGIVSALGRQDRAPLTLTQQLGEHNGAEHHIAWHWRLVATGCVGHAQVHQLPTVLLTSDYLCGLLGIC